MKESILYILYSDKDDEYEYKKIINNRFIITIVKTNIDKAEATLIGTRYSTIYCDAAFTQTLNGQEVIRKIFKPCANIGKKEFYLI